MNTRSGFERAARALALLVTALALAGCVAGASYGGRPSTPYKGDAPWNIP